MTGQATLWFLAGTLLPSFSLAWVLTFLVRRLAPWFGLIDHPNLRKVHVTPTPLGGGLAIGLGVIGTFLLGDCLLRWLGHVPEAVGLIPQFARPHLDGLVAQRSSLWVLLAAASALMLLGLCDDRRGVDWRIRLGIQAVVALVCVLTQGWRLTVFIDVPRWSWLISVVLSTVWIVALVNAFNMLDNMDGLSAGVAAIAGGILAAVLLVAPDPTTQRPQLFVAGFLLVLVGSLSGFLWHNRPPARVFMGDAGSYFVGFCIAVATLLATYASYQGGRSHAVLAPLCVMAVPLYDMASVVCIRLSEGRSPFEADKSHFSHRLVELGLTKTQAVLTIYLLTATCGLGAVVLRRVDAVGAAAVLLMVLCVLVLIAILESTARRKLRE